MYIKVKILLLVSLVLLTIAGCGGDSSKGGLGSEHGLLNNPPVAKEKNVTVKEGSDIQVKLDAVDIDGDTLSYKVITEPAHGSISGSAPDLVYTPEAGYSGRDFFTFKVNDGELDSNIAKVNIIVEANKDSNIENLKEMLNDSTIPYTTDKDFNKSEYAKKHLSDKEARRLHRMHDLVSVAKDPDPKWFSTYVDTPVIIAKSGNEYTIHLKKEDKNGVAYAPVDNDKLRLVVKIQRAKDNFEYVTNVNIDKYAHWDGAGVLKIYVPDSLDKGRLLVGVRPNFSNVATSAIAERWSTLISAEVWKMKDNVVVVNPKNVLFPIENDKLKGLAKESIFTLDDIAKETKRYLVDKKSIVLPMVLKDTAIKKEKLVSYTFKGKPYAGRVKKVITKNNQQFIILSPEYFNVYEIMDLEDGFAQKEGLLPAHVIYREGEAFVSDINESDPTKFSARELDRRTITSFFKQSCTVGKSELTYSPTFSLYPLDASVSISVQALSGDTECKWEATTKPFDLDKLLAKLGPVGAVLEGIFGAGGELKPVGTVTIKVDQAPGFGLKAGYSLAKGGSFNVNSLAKTLGGLGSRDLTLLTSSASAEISGNIGFKFSIKAISDDGAIGIVFKWLHLNFATIGLTANAGIKEGLYANIKNAREVYESKKSSDIAFNIVASADISATPDMKNLFNALSIEITLEAKTPEFKILEAKATAESIFTSVTDDKEGKASVDDLMLTSRYLRKLLSTPKGVLAPTDEHSSVYNDHTESISYDKKECDIEVPAIACAGWMCGNVKKSVKLCVDNNKSIDVSVTSVVANAKVEKKASGSIGIKVKGEADLNIDASPLKPKESALSLKDSSKTLEVTKVCPAKAGTYKGKTVITATSKDGKESVVKEARNIVVCHADDYRGDPHIVTSDGLGYDYYASGDYILSRIKNVTGYEIQARFLPGHKTSWPQAIALQVGNDVVEIQGRKHTVTGVTMNILNVWLNGKYLDLGNNYGYRTIKKVIKLPSGGMLAITKTISRWHYMLAKEITVIWPENSATKNYGVVLSALDYREPNGHVVKDTEPFVHIQIARPDDFAGQERGLMGNNDGNPKNDFIRRNGEVLGVDHNISFTELYALFGTDWLVRPYESLFRNPEAIKPEFPSDVITLTDKQRALGEEACRELTGFYKEACIIDVGLTGSAELVKEYYANTKDLNDLSSHIITPSVDEAKYSISMGSIDYYSDSKDTKIHYKQSIDINKESGNGKFILTLRAPRGAKALLDNNSTVYTGDGNSSRSFELDCTKTYSSTDSNFYKRVGALQLWLQDPLSGTASKMIKEIPLSCISKSYYPILVDKSKFPTTIDLKDLNSSNYKYTFKVDVEDIKYGNYGFDVKIYKNKISKETKVSDTSEYTHDFKKEKSFKLYYVVTAPHGHSQTFEKDIKLINYKLIDKSKFPTNIDAKDLLGFSYKFKVDVKNEKDYNYNLDVKIYKNKISKETKVSDTSEYTHDFKNEMSFKLYYVVTAPYGYSQTFEKDIKLVNYGFIDNTEVPQQVECKDLINGKYSFDINVTSVADSNISIKVYQSTLTGTYQEVKDSTHVTVDFTIHKGYRYIMYVVKNKFTTKTYEKSIYLKPTKFIDNTFSKYLVPINLSDLSDGKYTFDINVTSIPEENITMDIFINDNPFGEDLKVSSNNIYEHDFANGSLRFLLLYNAKTPGGCSKEFVREVVLDDKLAEDNSTFPTEIDASLLKDGKYKFDINITSPLTKDIKIEIYKGDKYRGGIKVSDTNTYTHDFSQEKSFDMYYYAYNKKGHTLGDFVKHIKLVNYEYKDNTVIPSNIRKSDLKDGKYTFKINAVSNVDEKMDYYIEIEDLDTGEVITSTNSNTYTHDFINGKKSFALYYRIKSIHGYDYGYQKVQLTDYLEDHSTFDSEIDVRDLKDGKYTFEINITSPFDENLTYATYSINPKYGGEKIAEGRYYTHDFNKKSSFAFYYGATNEAGETIAFYKYIQLKNAETIDNSTFPTELEFSDLQDGKYTFELNVSSRIGLPLRVEMYKGDPNNGGVKVSDNNRYTHDFENENSFYLYYKVFFPSGYVKTVYKGHIVLVSNKLTMYAKNTQQHLGKFSDDKSQTFSVAEDKEHNLLYLADGLNGLTVLDTSDIKDLKRIATYKVDGLSYHLVLSPNKKVLYLLTSTKGLYIIDVTNPKLPNLLKHLTIEGYSNTLALSADGKTIYISNQDRGMRVIDVTTPADAKEIGSLDTDGSVNSIKLSKDGSKAYIADLQNGLIIADVTNPKLPQIEGHVVPKGRVYDLAPSEDGKLLYLTSYTDGLSVVDISDTTAPQIINNYNDISAIQVASTNDNTIYALGRGELYKLDVNDPNSIKIEQTYETSIFNFNFNISQDKTKLYLSEYTNGIKILDIDLPYKSNIFTKYNNGGYAFAAGLCKTGIFDTKTTRLCVSNGSGGFLILNMTEDSNLTLFKHINVGGFTRDFTLFNNSAYVVNDLGGFKVIDLSSTYDIQDSFEGNTSTHDIQPNIDDFGLFVADTKKGLVYVRYKILDSSKKELEYYSSCDTNGTAYSLAVSNNDDKVYLVNNDNTMVVVDVSNLKDPHIIGRWHNSNGMFEHILLSKDNKTAYIADGNNGLLILDIQDPTKPILKHSVKLEGHAETIVLSQNEQVAYITTGFGVAMVDLSGNLPVLVTNYTIGGYTDGITFNKDETKAYIAAGSGGVVGLNLNIDTLYYKKDFGQDSVKIKIPKGMNVTLDFSIEADRSDIIEVGDYDEEITPNEYPDDTISIPIKSIPNKTGQTVLRAKIKFGSIEYTRIIYVNVYR